jgi:hypothetical protein
MTRSLVYSDANLVLKLVRALIWHILPEIRLPSFVLRRVKKCQPDHGLFSRA